MLSGHIMRIKYNVKTGNLGSRAAKTMEKDTGR
jgi:hypothetical protein